MEARPDPGIAVEGSDPDGHHVRIVGAPAPERRAALAAEDLREASSPGRYSRSSASPCTMRSEPGAIRADTEAAVPVRRWQRVQWH